MTEIPATQATLTQLIRAIPPHDALESEQIEATLAWIATGAPLYRLDRADEPPQHLVAYFLLYDAERRKLLLVDHIKAGLWLPSGGHVEPDEHPQQTVAREVQEELGIEAAFWSSTPLFLTVTPTVGNVARHIDVSLWYLLRGDSTQPLHFDASEFHQVAWFGLDALPLERSDPHLARFAAKLALRSGEWMVAPSQTKTTRETTARPLMEADYADIEEMVAGLSEWFDQTARIKAIPVDIRYQRGFVAVRQGQIAGFITLYVADGKLNIGWLGVRSEFHRQGIGRLLLAQAVAVAHELGLHELATYTLGDSVDYAPYEATRHFYFANGFQVYQRNQTDNPGCPEEIKIVKRVD